MLLTTLDSRIISIMLKHSRQQNNGSQPIARKRNKMSKKKIQQAFDEMVRYCDNVYTLHHAGEFYVDYVEYQNKLNEIKNHFFDLVRSAYMLDLISEEKYNFAHELVRKYYNYEKYIR